MLKLYNFGWGRYPRRVTIYLAEKGISDIEVVEVEFPHRPELWPEGFLFKLNPAHPLPVLDTGKGVLIDQSIAILGYLEELYPSPNMIGETLEEHAQARELVSIFEEATAFLAYGRGRAVVSTPIGIGPVRRRPRSAPNGSRASFAWLRRS